MAGNVIADARRRAKTMSRTAAYTYQQALDAVARDEGYGTWKEMLDIAESRQSAEVATATTDQTHRATRPDWRMQIIEVAEGSRQSKIDETMVRTIGRPLATVSRAVGIAPWIVAVALPVGIMVAAALSSDRSMGITGVSGTICTAIMGTIVTYVCVMATMRNPDGRGARRLRRNARILSVMLPTMTLSLLIPLSTGRGMTIISIQEAIALVGPLSIYPLAISIGLWTAAWEGRRYRREASSGQRTMAS